MELKPFNNIIHFFCYVSRSFTLQKYNNSHEINSLYAESWKPFFKTKNAPFVKQMQIGVKPL